VRFAVTRLTRETWLLVGTLLIAIAGSAASACLVDSRGLDCQDYPNAEWKDEPFQTRIARDPAAPDLMTSPGLHHERFSSECRGHVVVPADGMYLFVLHSDDGSELYIDSTRVVDNRGTHEMRRRAGGVWLTRGGHALRVRYAQDGGDYGFALQMGRERNVMRPLDARVVSRWPLPSVAVWLRRFVWPAPVFLFSAWLIVAARHSKLRLATGFRLVSRLHHALTRNPRRSIAIVVAAGVAARLCLTFGTYSILWPDSYPYFFTAQRQLLGDFTAHEIFRTPLFSTFMAMFLLAGETPVAGALMIAAQRALGVAASVLVYRIGQAAFCPGVAFYGALLWTLSPLQLYYETVVGSEALFGFLVVSMVSVASAAVRNGSRLQYAGVGLLCALATLTRPVGKALALVVVAVLALHPRRPSVDRLALVIACYLACVMPWMYVNSRVSGFFAISRGEGVLLFMRAFDVDRLDPPVQTRYPVVQEVFDELRLRRPVLYYPVRDTLNRNMGYSVLFADRLMFGFALEAIAEHPTRFAANTITEWLALFLWPHRSVHVCQSSFGPHLCSERTVGQSHHVFSNTPFPGYVRLKTAIAWYVDRLYWLMPLLTPVAALGVVSWMMTRRPRNAVPALLAAVIGYFTIVTVVFNTVEDRFRLPVDPFIALFAVEGLRRVIFGNRKESHSVTPAESQCA